MHHCYLLKLSIAKFYYYFPKIMPSNISDKAKDFKGNLRRILMQSQPKKVNFLKKNPPALQWMTKDSADKRKNAMLNKLKPIKTADVSQRLLTIKAQSKSRRFLTQDGDDGQSFLQKSMEEDKNFQYLDVALQKQLINKKREQKQKNQRLKTVLDRYKSYHRPINASNSRINTLNRCGNESALETYSYNNSAFQSPEKDRKQPNYRQYSSQKKQYSSEKKNVGVSKGSAQKKQSNETLSYVQMVKKRENDEQSSRLVIMKKIIEENVRKKNKEMLINGKKKLKALI